MKKEILETLTECVPGIIILILAAILMFSIVILAIPTTPVEFDYAHITIGQQYYCVEIESISYHGDCVYITGTDGKTYHVDQENVVLIDTGE